MLKNLTYIEWIENIGVFFGYICVVLTAIENIWCWPTGIISVFAYIIFYYKLKLYANMVLHVVYLVACLMGWYQWLHVRPDNSTLQISYTKKKHFLPLTVVTLLMFLIVGIVTATFTNDVMPFEDSLLMALSLTAQWMMNNKLIECWLIWIVTDVIYTVMHYQMGNYKTTSLYAVYVVTATIAYYLWKRSIRKTTTR